MTGEVSWLEQVLGVLNADHKDLLSEYPGADSGLVTSIEITNFFLQ